jgi:hypothetical protein
MDPIEDRNLIKQSDSMATLNIAAALFAAALLSLYVLV